MTRIAAVVAAWAVLFAGGCASDPDKEFAKEMTRLTPVEAPTFLTGDLAGLFGSANFSARAEVQRGLPGTRPPMVGDLLGREGSLFFIADEQRGKRGLAGGLSVLWHGPTQTAYLLNEPLQGFAPLRHSATNGPMEAVVMGEEEISGVRVRRSLVSLREGAESVPAFIVWRAPAQGDLPVKVQTTNGTSAITMTLSRVRLEAPPAEWFELPNGFKAHESADAMLSELTRRRSEAMSARARAQRAKYGDPKLDDEEAPMMSRPMRPY